MTTEIKEVYGHYIVLLDGKFYCSADSYSEASQDACELESEMSTAQN